MLVTCCAEQRTQGRSWLNQELKGWPRKRVLKRNPQSECCVTSVMSGAMSLAMMPVGCQVARSKQRAKGGKPETRVDENPKQKPRRTKRGTLSAREAQNEQGFWRAEEEEEERTERGSTRKRKGSRLADQGVIRMGVSSGQVSRKRGNQGDAWMGMVCPRVLPVLRRGSQMASGPKLGWRSETRQGGSRAVKMDASDALSGP